MPLRQWLIDELPAEMRPPKVDSEEWCENGYLLCLCSSTVDLEGINSLSAVHARFVPLLPGYFSGVGDLFSAFLLGHFQKKELLPLPEGHETPLSYATSMALTKTHAVLESTYQYTLTLPEDERQPTDVEMDIADPARKIRRMRGRELKLVQPEGQNIIRGVGDINIRHMDLWTNFWCID